MCHLGLMYDMPLSLLAMLLFLPRLVAAQSGMCRLRPAEPLFTDVRLDGYQVSHLMGFKIERCVLECFLVKLCVSFNYREHLGVCELNKATVDEVGNYTLVNATGFGHHELQAWDDFRVMAGTCASKPCAEDQRCIRTTPTHTCVVVDCGPPPPYLHGYPPFQFYATATPAVTTLGSKAIYTCNNHWATNDKYEENLDSPFYNTGNKICNSDFTWTKNLRVCYSRIDNCKHISRCNPSYGDGHYWIKGESAARSLVALYCHNMTSDEPQNFITLPPGVNMAVDMGDGVTGLASTTYHKIRVEPITKYFHVDLTDTTFADITGSEVPFGTAASCHGDGETTPKVYGLFNIDTTGTGMVVSSTTNWTANPSETTDLVAFTNTGTKVTGRCWGACGSSCHPEGGILTLEWDYNILGVVDGSEVILPECV